jgi:MerR family transcriptional regulator, light-induced transcriptional regulator
LTHYSPKQVAERLGVSESSVKRWLDQGAVPILRTAGGHRRVSQESVERLLEQLKAMSGFPRISSLGDDGLPGSDPKTADGIGDELMVGASLHDRPVAEVADAFRIALMDGRETVCRDLIDELIRRGLSPSTAADLLITPAMHGFGHQWQKGELAIYQERRACGIAAELIADLRRQLPVSADGPLAIGGAPEGDMYQLPTALVELALCENGWRAKSLGCNLPMSEFREAVREYQPKVVWVSLSCLADEEKFVREFNETADALPKQTALLIGGRAATDTLRPRLRYTGHCDSLRNLIDLAQTLAGKR